MAESKQRKVQVRVLPHIHTLAPLIDSLLPLPFFNCHTPPLPNRPTLLSLQSLPYVHVCKIIVMKHVYCPTYKIQYSKVKTMNLTRYSSVIACCMGGTARVAVIWATEHCHTAGVALALGRLRKKNHNETGLLPTYVPY